MGGAAFAEGAAIAATVVATVGALPQVRRTLASGDVRGVSVTSPSLGIATELAWVGYAVHERLWSALPEAVLMVVANVVLVVVLCRAGSAARVAVPAAMAWGTVLGLTAVLGGPAAIAALLGLAYAVQVGPAVWCAYRARAPAGVARATWLLLALESALWFIYATAHGDPAMLTFAAIGITASAAILLRTRAFPILTTLGCAQRNQVSEESLISASG